MKIKKVDNKIIWDTWIVEHTKRSPFLQSWEWGELLKREGKQIERLGVYQGEEVVGVLQVTYHPLMFGWKYAFAPWGPIFSLAMGVAGRPEIYALLADYFKQKKCLFFRIEPEKIGARRVGLKKIKDVEARQTLILNLDKPFEEIAQDFSKETRYSIRQAEKKGVIVEERKDAGVLIDFLKEISARQKFRMHPEKHYQEIIFSPLSFQLIAMHEGQVVGTGVFVVFGTTGTYLFGANDFNARSLMSQYAILNQAIKKAVNLGCKYFDFYGVAPMVNPPWQVSEVNSLNPGVVKDYAYDNKHSEAGFTQFKLGFGGEVHYTVGTWDLLISPMKYRVYTGLRFLRRLMSSR